MTAEERTTLWELVAGWRADAAYSDQRSGSEWDVGRARAYRAAADALAEVLTETVDSAEGEP